MSVPSLPTSDVEHPGPPSASQPSDARSAAHAETRAENSLSSVERPQTKAEQRHLAHVEGLRAVAALMVYLNHAYAQSWNPIRSEYPAFPLNLFTYTLVTGHFAVTVFIAVSGFCLVLPALKTLELRDGLWGFILRRARRILPPYYAALFLCLLLIATVIGEPTGSLWDVPIVIDWQAIVSHLLLLQDFFRTGRINYVFWSIATEWHIYFLFPALLWLARRGGLRVLVPASLLLGFAVSFAIADSRAGRANVHYVGVFALGMFAAFLAYGDGAKYESTRKWPHFNHLALGVALALTLTVAWLGWNIDKTTVIALDALVAALAFLVLVGTSSKVNSQLHRLLSMRMLAFLGTFSYSFYLIHAPVLQLMWQYITRPLELSHTQTFLFLNTVGLFFTLTASYGFFWLFERPFLNRSRRMSIR